MKNENASLYDRLQALPELVNRFNGHSYIQLLDSVELSVEGCSGILKYDENIIVMRLSKVNCTVTGLNLCVENFSMGCLTIKGKLHSVTFEDRGEQDAQ